MPDQHDDDIEFEELDDFVAPSMPAGIILPVSPTFPIPWALV